MISFPDHVMTLLRTCRNTIPTAAEEYGFHLADRLNEFFHKHFICRPPFQGMQLCLDSASLLQATISYSIDMACLIGFHTVEPPDNHKMAAYLFKWLSKLRPVRFIPAYTRQQDMVEAYGNASFAYLCAKRYLDIKDDLPANELEFILYSSTHRDIHPEEWSGIFYFMEQVKKAAEAGSEVAQRVAGA